MKVRSVLVTVLVVSLSVVTARGDPPKQPDNTKLINAIMQVESNADDNASGDNGKALGCLQIHKVIVDDVNRIAGTNFTYNDRLDRGKSIQMFNIYTAHYSPGGNAEIIARRWNGGPKGDSKVATQAYWRKVQRRLSSA